MSAEEKAARIERAGGCPKCSSWHHGPGQCRNRRPTLCKAKVGAGLCNRPHLEMLHESKNAYCEANMAVNVTITERGDMVLLGVQKVKVVGKSSKEGVLLYDSGSTLTLCRHEWATREGYVGRPVEIYLKVLAHQYEKVRTMEYKVTFLNTKGQRVVVLAIGLDSLTQEAPGGNLESAYSQFADIPRGEIARPEGHMDVLLGQDYAGYLPRVERAEGHLLLLRSEFGSGRLLSGRTGIEGVTIFGSKKFWIK